MSQKTYRYLGLLFWLAASVATLFSIIQSAKARSDSVGKHVDAPSVTSYLTGAVEQLTAMDSTHRLRKYDPVFFQTEKDDWRQVGFVESVNSKNDSDPVLTIAWYDTRVDTSQVVLDYHFSSGSIDEVLGMMLPAEKRRRIHERLATAFDQHDEAFSRAFVPLVRLSLERSMPIVKEELRASVERHRGEFEALSERWKEELIEEKLAPLARSEILPIVHRNGQPTAEVIGREIWERASLWRFGWRAVYDKAPLTDRNLVQEEWLRFVAQEVSPVFESHIDEIVEAIQNSLVDIASNKKIRSGLSDVVEQVVSDAEAQELVKSIVKETLVENERLHRVWQDVWQSEEAGRAFAVVGEKMEPVIRQIGDELFGTRETGIDPMFALALRNQVLGKDRRWLVARIGGQPVDRSTRRIQVAKGTMAYPVIYLATDSHNESKDLAESLPQKP